jgi:hypothetical protein
LVGRNRTHYPCFHPQQEKTSKVSLHKQWLPYMHIIMNMSYYIL